jgi:hypothetical protein
LTKSFYLLNIFPLLNMCVSYLADYKLDVSKKHQFLKLYKLYITRVHK